MTDTVRAPIKSVSIAMDASAGVGNLPPRPGSGRPELANVAVFGPFRLDSKRRALTAGGQDVPLQPRAFDLLELFVACPGQVLSNDEIVGHVWRGIAVGDNNLGVQLSALRRALAEHGGQGLIVTVPGRGYRFIGDVAEAPSTLAPPAAQAPAQTTNQRPRSVHLNVRTTVSCVLVLACLVGLVAWRVSSPAGRPSPAASSAPFNPPPHSLAVLAFVNLSSDPAQDYLADGLSEAVIDALSQVQQLQVTARTSSFSFKGKSATIDEIARKLNVEYVLEGSLRRQGDHLRIDAHLSDARTGYERWAQSYDLQVVDMLKVQDEIAGEVTNALQVKLLETDASGHDLGGHDLGGHDLGGTNNSQALDAYLRGEQLAREGADGQGPALTYFQHATSLDPNFALAQSGLAGTLAILANFSDKYDDVYRQKLAEARRIAERAIALAPGLGLSHARLALILWFSAADIDVAWAEANRAVSLAPGDAEVLGIYAHIASVVGHNDEAIAAARRAVKLDPLQPGSWMGLGKAFEFAHKYDAALDAINTGLSLAGHTLFLYKVEPPTLLLEQGKAEAALKLCPVPGGEWSLLCTIRANYMLGRKSDVDKELAEMEATHNETMAYNFAGVYAQVNQPVMAMQWLRKASELRDGALTDMKADPSLDPIRAQPGFNDIENTLHYPR